MYGLHIVDVSNPQEPFVVGLWQTFGLIYDIALNGDYAYIADPMLGLHVINISDPTSPIPANVFNTMYSSTVAIHENRLYLYSGLLRVYELTDPETPVLAGTYDFPEAEIAYDIAFTENLAYTVSSEWLRVLDISTPAAIVEVGSERLTNYSGAIAISGTHAFVSEGYEEMGVYDISNPAEPTLLNLFNTDIVNDGAVIDLAAAGDYVYLSDKGRGLKVYNVSDPLSLQLVGWHRASWETSEVLADENIVYLNKQFGIEIFDVSAALPAMDTPPALASQFSLHPIYPNPFNNTANITFDLPREVTGRLVVYDVLGRMTNTLYDGKFSAGTHTMQFNGNGLSSGTYFIRLETPTFNATQKATLLK